MLWYLDTLLQETVDWKNYGFAARRRKRTALWKIKRMARCRGNTLVKAYPTSEFILVLQNGRLCAALLGL